MAAGIDLKRVQKGRGKVHLTPAIRQGDAVRTLCGQEFAAGSAREVDAEADCSICDRRRRNPAAVSSAFFAEDVGSELLELSLREARERPRPARREREAPRPAAAKPRPAAPVEPEPTPPPPSRLGELDSSRLREFSDNVYLGSGGAIVRMERGRVAEVVGEGRYQLLRRGGRLTLLAGGVVVEGSVSDLEVRADPDAKG